MKFFVIAFLSLATLNLSYSKDFFYNKAKGFCENNKKEKGYNKVNIKKLFSVTLEEAEDKDFIPKLDYKLISS